MSLDEESAVILAMRVIAFCIGAALLISGVIDLANATQQQIFPSISTGATGFVKTLVGLILMALGIEPGILRIIIEWIIR